jgi:hypothetical protein
MLFKTVATKNVIFVYTAPNNAWIFPHEALEGQVEQLLELLRQHLPEGKLKWTAKN